MKAQCHILDLYCDCDCEVGFKWLLDTTTDHEHNMGKDVAAKNVSFTSVQKRKDDLRALRQQYCLFLSVELESGRNNIVYFDDH